MLSRKWIACLAVALQIACVPAPAPAPAGDSSDAVLAFCQQADACEVRSLAVCRAEQEGLLEDPRAADDAGCNAFVELNLAVYACRARLPCEDFLLGSACPVEEAALDAFADDRAFRCQAGQPADPPADWTCDADRYFARNETCDCGCGVPDPDCFDEGCAEPGCSTDICENCVGDDGVLVGCEG
jgi:hypothetical protein